MQGSVTAAHGQSYRHAHIGRMELKHDIIIVGGGLNGCSQALALARSGFEVALVESLPARTRAAHDFDGRSYALSLTSKKLLQAIGLWDQVHAQSQPILEIKATDGRPGTGPSPFVLEFDHAEIEEGPMGYMIEDRFLRDALLDAIDAENRISTFNGATIVAQDTQGPFATATLHSGEVLTAQLIIGCDGRKSATATRAGVKRSGWDYGQTALVCAIAHEQPHHGVAHQFFMPAGPLAILPLPGNRCSIVWTEETKNAARIQSLSDDGYLEELRPRFGDFLGEISLAGTRFSYPLSLTLADRFCADRVALVGDAAHGVHPLAGQGLNAGLKDVAALTEILTLAMRRGEDFGRIDVLERYQQWRRFDVITLAAVTDTFNKLFSNDNSLLRIGRDLGMGFVNALPGVRRSLIREAAGLTGDLPQLLQGRPI